MRARVSRTRKQDMKEWRSCVRFQLKKKKVKSKREDKHKLRCEMRTIVRRGCGVVRVTRVRRRLSAS